MGEVFEGSAVYMDGKLICTAGRVELERATEAVQRVGVAMQSVSIQCALTAESAAKLAMLFRRIERWRWRIRTLRYQLKRKGKPGWRYIR